MTADGVPEGKGGRVDPGSAGVFTVTTHCNLLESMNETEAFLMAFKTQTLYPH